MMDFVFNEGIGLEECVDSSNIHSSLSCTFPLHVWVYDAGVAYANIAHLTDWAMEIII